GADGSGPRGAKLSDVLAGGAAQRAGLKVGDTITKLEGKRVESVDQLIVTLRSFKVGDTITVTYLRVGRTQTARLTLQDKKPG
ncbi:MAG: peptidase and chymotrypsin/Hap, partial [Frankiales bacterium]|nr:peptidase and chymotrypsin/Hap [Frankiales bacterium]